MSLISKPYTFTNGATIVAAEHNSNFDTIYSDYSGNIQNANIASNAAITDSKLAQVATAGKVSGAALTALSSVPSGAGVLPAVNGGCFSGMVAMWSGTIATIPTGWYLCDGSNSTPDLRNRFIVCANADSGGAAKSTITGAAAQTGGSTTISTSNLPAHTHTGVTRTSRGTNSGSEDYWTTNPAGSAGSQDTGSTGSGSAYTQPFYALAYIMKS